MVRTKSAVRWRDVVLRTLFADILRELVSSVARLPADDVAHRDQLAQAAAELRDALLI